MKIYKNLLEIADNFDVFFFDAFGVFWNGDNFFPDVQKTMAELVSRGKYVCVLSNSVNTNKDGMDFYAKYGFTKGIHYNEFIYSGEVAKYIFKNNKLEFKNNKNPTKYYILGYPKPEIFEGTDFIKVSNPKEADFIYMSEPLLNEEEKNNFSYPEFLFESKMPKGDIGRMWDTTSELFFKTQLENLIKYNLPMFSANPDLMASQGEKGTNKIHFILRQGTFSNIYRKMGGEVFEIGKPDSFIYNYAFDLLNKNGIKLDKKRTCMIGDTVRTDIKGGNGVGIKTILTLKTGITALEVFKNNTIDETTLNNIFEAENVKADFLIESVSGKL